MTSNSASPSILPTVTVLSLPNVGIPTAPDLTVHSAVKRSTLHARSTGPVISLPTKMISGPSSYWLPASRLATAGCDSTPYEALGSRISHSRYGLRADVYGKTLQSPHVWSALLPSSLSATALPLSTYAQIC